MGIPACSGKLLDPPPSLKWDWVFFFFLRLFFSLVGWAKVGKVGEVGKREDLDVNGSAWRGKKKKKKRKQYVHVLSHWLHRRAGCACAGCTYRRPHAALAGAPHQLLPSPSNFLQVGKTSGRHTSNRFLPFPTFLVFLLLPSSSFLPCWKKI